MGYGSSSHSECLALLAMRLDEIEVLTKLIDKDGHIYMSETGTILPDGTPIVRRLVKAHPAVAQRGEAARHSQSLLSNFGLTPASVLRIAIHDGTDSGDWEGFV